MILDAAVLVNPNNDTMWYSWVQPSGMVLWDSKANTYIYIYIIIDSVDLKAKSGGMSWP